MQRVNVDLLFVPTPCEGGQRVEKNKIPAQDSNFGG